MLPQNPPYSQTFENKSSPPIPPKGFGAVPGPVPRALAFVVVVGAALLHPPKSSSALIRGDVVFAAEPHPGDFGAAVCEAVVVVVLLEPPHASFVPQASRFDKPENLGAAAGCALGCCGTGAGVERLKAELRLIEGEAAAGLGGAEGAGAGVEKPNRSPIPELELAAGLGGAVVVVGAKDAKSPKPLDELKVLCFCGGGLLAGGDLGAVSKKLPPPPKAEEDGVER